MLLAVAALLGISNGWAIKCCYMPQLMCLPALQLASIFAVVNDRMSTLEETVRAQQEMLMDVSYQVDSKENGPKLPFISGTSSL